MPNFGDVPRRRAISSGDARFLDEPVKERRSAHQDVPARRTDHIHELMQDAARQKDAVPRSGGAERRRESL
jgi:polyhydroxyalkanoate synthesis regulator phasin